MGTTYIPHNNLYRISWHIVLIASIELPEDDAKNEQTPSLCFTLAHTSLLEEVEALLRDCLSE